MTGDERIGLLRRAIAYAAEAGRWAEAKAVIAELEETARAFYRIEAESLGSSDLIGPERSEGPPLARSDHRELVEGLDREPAVECGHAGNTPARCDISYLRAAAAGDEVAPRAALGVVRRYEGGRTA